MKRLIVLLFGIFLAASGAQVLAGTTPDKAPGKPALLVIDMQKAFLPYMDEKEVQAGTTMINATIDLFRKAGLPVIRVYHTDPERGPKPGSDGFAFAADVHVKDTDPQVIKNYPSGFKKTELGQVLEDLGCDTVFLCGLSSVGCVLATYFEAQGLEYTTFMVKDALISHRSDLTQSVEDITDAVGYEAIAYMLGIHGK